MRFTIEGFSQARLVELGLGYVEAALLRWLVDFAHTGKMREITDEGGRRLWWVRYDTVAADLPVLGISNVEVMRRRFARLVVAGVLVHQHVQQRGRFSYYGFGPQYESLIADTDHQTDQSSEGREEQDHPTDESSEDDEEGVHSTVESVPIRPFGRLPLDSTVGSNDSSTKDSSTRTEDARAYTREDGELDHLPPHMRLAVAWYKRLAKKTGKLIAPAGEDFLAAQKACERTTLETLMAAIDPYFAKDYWFTRDRTTKKPTYSFRGFLAHFPEVLASAEIEKPKGPPSGERACPACGKTLSFGTGRFVVCRCGKAWEIDDAGELEDVSREPVEVPRA